MNTGSTTYNPNFRGSVTTNLVAPIVVRKTLLNVVGLVVLIINDHSGM